MDQGTIIGVGLAIGVPGLGIVAFLVMRAPTLHTDLEGRALDASTILNLAAAQLVRELRDDLNEALLRFDKGFDPYLTRVDYAQPLPILRRYKQLATLELAARLAPQRVQRRLRDTVWPTVSVVALMIVTVCLAALEDLFGIEPAQIALSVSSALLIVSLFLGGRALVPYRSVHNAEIRGQVEVAQRPALAIAVAATGINSRAAADTSKAGDQGEW